MEEIIACIGLALIIIFGIASTIQEINTKGEIARLSLNLQGRR